MCGVFTLLDVPSQAIAVQRLLRGWSSEEKVAWFSAHGKLTPKPKLRPDEHQTYWFESRIGLQCAFFFSGDKLVFIGDHTTYTIDDPEM
jgi:hypothetical protein